MKCTMYSNPCTEMRWANMALCLLHDHIWPGHLRQTLSSLPGQTRIPTFCWWPDDIVTHESIHPSVLHQSSVSPVLSGILTLHPRIVSPLLPFEEEMKAKWAYDPSSPSTLAYQKKLKDQPKISNPMTVSAVQADKLDPTLLGSFFPCFVDRSQ